MSPVVTFAAVFRELATDHRVIAYDRAGYGMSDPAPLSVELQVGDLVALLEEVGPAVVVGHSWGGLLAQLATWERPELVSALVLLDPSHETFWQDAEPLPRADRSRPPTEHPRYEEVLTSAEQLAEEIANSLERYDASQAGRPATGQEPAAEHRLENTSGLAASVRRRAAGEPGDSLGRGEPDLVSACRSYLRTDEQLFTYLDELPMVFQELGELRERRAKAVWPEVPVVVLTATKGRPAEFTPWVIAVQEQLAAECGGRHQVVPESGHYLQIDCPAFVSETVRATAERSRAAG